RRLDLASAQQFSGGVHDPESGPSSLFARVDEQHPQLYYRGIFHERHARAQLSAGSPPQEVAAELEEAMRCFQGAEQRRPAGNDEAILRWNRCVRLLEQIPMPEPREEMQSFESGDTSPQFPARTTPLRAGRSR